MKWKGENFKRFLIFPISLWIGIVCLEFFLRAYFSSFLNYDVEMWRYATVLKESVPDNRSHIHVPGISASIMGTNVAINSKWLRDREFEYEKPQGVTRILVLGDSVTFGFWVDEEKAFPKIFEKCLNEKAFGGIDGFNKYEVINAGIGNYNTKQELAFYETELRKYDADQIILAWYVNDAEETQKYRENALTRNSIAYAFLVGTWRKILAISKPELRFEPYYSALYSGENWEKYEKTLTNVAKVFDNRKLTVVLLPELRILQPYPFISVHSKVRGFFETRGYRVIDVLPAFGNEKPESLHVAKDDAHPNARGHERIWEYLFSHWNDAQKK